MDEKEKHYASMALAEFFAKRNNERRSYEWKVTLGLWALLVGAIRYRACLPAWIYVAVVLIYAFFWLRPLAVSHRADQIMSIHYREQAEAVLTDPAHTVRSKKVDTPCLVCLIGFFCNWYLLFQLLTTTLLCWLAWRATS
jgi:hypothetical protein